jgi:hypothetical protein
MVKSESGVVDEFNNVEQKIIQALVIGLLLKCLPIVSSLLWDVTL